MQKRLDQFLHQLYLKHAATLWKRARRILGDAQKAEDMVHEVFFLAAKKANQLIVHPNPAAWLHKTMNHLLYHALRKSAMEEILFGDDTKLFFPATPMESISFSLPEHLSDTDKEILQLRYEQNMSYSEISDHFGISLSAVKMRLQRAKARCKEKL
ncbi:MAG: RNA polymerase sigma factor [Firmicutes bacterium]|nr:RNA polymerase sigma factor [Bacillota bacterium]